MLNIERVQNLLKTRGITYAELAKKIGIHTSAAHRYCTGVTKNVPDERVNDIAKALGTTPEYLLGWDSEDPKTDKERDLLAAYNSLSDQNRELLDDLLDRLIQSQK